MSHFLVADGWDIINKYANQMRINSLFIAAKIRIDVKSVVINFKNTFISIFTSIKIESILNSHIKSIFFISEIVYL